MQEQLMQNFNSFLNQQTCNNTYMLSQRDQNKKKNFNTKTLIKQYFKNKGLTQLSVPQWPNKMTPIGGDANANRLKPKWEQMMVNFYNTKHGSYKQTRTPFNPHFFKDLQMESHGRIFSNKKDNRTQSDDVSSIFTNQVI
jgi:flagellin-like hook-associated protein FlgL